MTQRMTDAAGRQVRDRRRLLDAERRALDGARPEALLAARREHVGLLLDRAVHGLRRRLEERAVTLRRNADWLAGLLAGRLARAGGELGTTAAGLAALSPYATLERGYAIVRGPAGNVLRDAGGTRPGENLSIRLQRGEIDARVEKVRNSPP